MIRPHADTQRASTTKPGDRASRPNSRNPWNALWAMMVGFFMILLDSTIVAVANPSIMARLDAGYDAVIWVTSAYLLAYAVPLLVAGRLGDRFGPKNLYMIGLAVFTAASLWCGLSGSIGMLIAARVVQGIGAALLTPQTLSTITQTFPPERRGVAMSVWGATAGVATLVGPLAGGLLVDGPGWEWIFFINVPIGVVGLGLAVWLIPVLPTHTHRFDLAGVALSGVGMFLIVFALQQGESVGWAPWIWAVMVAGVGFMTVFIYWQSVNTHEPLIPLEIFRDRDFSLSNLAAAVIGFAITAMVLPVMFYTQAVRGLSPTRSALLIAPMAIASGLLAPIVGKIVDRSHPRPVVGFGFSTLAVALTWLSIEMAPATPIWRLILPFTAMGVGMAFIWAPLAVTATRNLPPQLAGAGSGVYNATRQLGTVLGSAGMAAFMTWRITAEMPMPGGGHPQRPEGGALQLPEFMREPFAAAMSQSTLLPAFIALFGIAAALFMAGFATSAVSRRTGAGDRLPGHSDGFDARTERISVMPHDGGFVDDDYDDDDYVEYTVRREPGSLPQLVEVEPAHAKDDAEDDTEPLKVHVHHPLPALAETWHGDAVESWHSMLDVGDRTDYRGSRAGIGSRMGEYRSGYESPSRHELHDGPFTPPASDYTGSQGARGRSYGDNRSANDAGYQSFWCSSSARHQFAADESPRNRHHLADLDDPASYGRHSSSQRD